jgi:hypothetical protein
MSDFAAAKMDAMVHVKRTRTDQVRANGKVVFQVLNIDQAQWKPERFVMTRGIIIPVFRRRYINADERN